MAKYAIIENGIVENIIEADSAFVVENNLAAVEVTQATGVPFVKGAFVDGVFHEPVRVQYNDNVDVESGIPAASFDQGAN